MITKLSLYKVKYSNIKTIPHILPEYNNIKLVHRGIPAHYQRIRQYSSILHQYQYQYYLYHREIVDIAYQMIKTNHNILTYITRYNYQTVQAIKVDKNVPLTIEIQTQGIQKDVSTIRIQKDKQITPDKMQHNKLKHFINNHKFQIINSFIDIHPSQSYHKMYQFMGLIKNNKISQLFTGCKFTKVPLGINTQYLPFLKQLNHRYLNTKQLKLRKLERIRMANIQEQQVALGKWRQLCPIQNMELISTTRQENQWKKRFVIEAGLGEYVTLESLLQGYGEKSYYAQWKNK